MEQLTESDTFDRLSHDVSGFGPNHREESFDEESERIKESRESCTTTGFDFYVRKLNNIQDAMINRERDLFSPPFKTRNGRE